MSRRPAKHAVLEELLAGLFHMAKVDGAVHTGELEYLRRVGAIFGFDAHAFERIRAQHMGPDAADPYQVLRLTRDATPCEEGRRPLRAELGPGEKTD